MSQAFTPQEGSCSCYSNTYTINHAPIGRFICHCTICQEYTGKAYNDVTVLFKSDLSELDINKTRFRRWKLPPNINRGLCKRCHKPSVEKAMGGALMLVPTDNYPNVDALLDPTMHLFYDSRVEDIEDDLPKYTGFAQSQTMIVKALAQGVFQRVTKR
ncbi:MULTISPECIES: GFA family protein [unclassified Psychrobacter]|uniref:GFA family protein n=1 Tax=unclassified Psychrobacter TaxID=196806 RepID=UPI003FCFBB4B